MRTTAPPAPVKGSQPKKRPGTKRRKKNKLHPWFWIKNKHKGKKCGGCKEEVGVGQVVAFSRPSKIRCGSCVRKNDLKVKTSAPLAKERRERVERQLREAAGDD
ncbi:MAG TPA: hypothetical protein VGV69_01135 [Solirubrobacterales bacterium]|nr:hypothetical protein [Solirubrobacterales bacterium]